MVETLMSPHLSRRDFLAASAAAAISPPIAIAGPAAAPAPKIGAATTIYHHNSHADVILTRLLRGHTLDDNKGLTFNTLDSDKKPTTKTTTGGSEINITGGGAIISPDGFKIEAGGCSIEMCGGVLTLKGAPIRLN